MANNQLPYIFVTGLFRSGTTLISRALSAHKSVDIYYQPCSAVFKHAVDVFLKLNALTKSIPMGDPFLIESFYNKFREHILTTEFCEQEIKEIKEKVLKDYEIDASEKNKKASLAFNQVDGVTFEQIFFSAMSKLTEISYKRTPAMVGVKEIWCEDFIPAFLSQDRHPIKCIHVIRDPRAIAASRNYGKYYEEGCNGQKYPLLFVGRSWRRSIQIYKRMLGKKNYFPFVYEAFVDDPEKMSRKLCHFLNIEYDPDMMDLNKFKRGDGRSWRGNIYSSQFSSITAERCTKWKSILSEDEVFLIEFLCSVEMKELGYEPMTDSSDSDRFIAMKEDQNALKSWLSKYNHCLNSKEKKIELRKRGLDIENKC